MKYYRCPRCKDYSYLHHNDFSYCSNCNFSQNMDEPDSKKSRCSLPSKEISNLFKKVDRKLRQHFYKNKNGNTDRNRKEPNEVKINDLFDAKID